MVIGEKDEKQPGAVTQQNMPPASIDNIMSGISNTGTVKMNNHRKKLRQRFDLIKKLGQGTYGKVQLGINKETSQDVAIKTIKKCKIETEADLVRIRREVQIMSSVQHPNIIHIYEVFENREKMVLVMEFAAGGELYDYLSERKVLTEDEARRIFRQIATAVYYCHKHKICHRDLKLENILLDEHGNAKIADFGLSNVFEEKRLLATFCGSPLYASPEIVKGTPYQGPEVDCWSLGVLLYTLVYGAMPFDGSNFKRLVKQISAGDYYEPKKPSNASPLIREMLTVCPKRRATIEQICNHWWVNEGYSECCLNLAEELANQTPVRLDVLLSLAPPGVTSEQLVVPNPTETESKPGVARSMSVGSIRDIGDLANTEAEQRIIEMVAAGGEAALAPSPTRTIEPSASMAQQPQPPTQQPQVKRKPENTISTDSMTGARKRDKPTEQIKSTQSKLTISEVMDVDVNQPQANQDQVTEKSVAELSSSTLPEVLDEEIKNDELAPESKSKNKADSDIIIEEVPPMELQKALTGEPKPPKTTLRTKTTDLSEVSATPKSDDRTTDEPVSKPTTERRKSRILEAAERFEANANAAIDKPKKIVVPKKEVERKMSAPQPSTKTTSPVTLDNAKRAEPHNKDNDKDKGVNDIANAKSEIVSNSSSGADVDLTKSDSKASNLSLDEARRSMENSIALLNQAKLESSNEVDQLCAKTENVAVSNKQDDGERQKQLKHAREIIGNAIPRLSGMGIRKPPVPFGQNGRSISGSVVPSSTLNANTINRHAATPPIDPRLPELPGEQSAINKNHATKSTSAEGTLKSATLPRRKIGRPDVEQKSQLPYHPTFNPVFPPRGISNEQQQTKPKEHYIPIQRVGYTSNTSSSQRSVLSRQSTNESDTSDTQTASTTTIGTQPSSLQTSNSSQPIKKSPREYIIPIAVEGGGFVTPRAGSLEPSESNNSATSTPFSRFGSRTRKISSLFNDSDDESINSPFQRMQRHTSIGRDSDTETTPSTGFTYRLRSTRPFKKLQQPDGNDSGSSGEEDDEDGFEILTAENLFSTLLSRVRALTNRLNVKEDTTSDFPSARFLNNFRQAHSPFWQRDPFASRLNSSGAWRHSMTRDLGTDIDSVFSPRTGATLPKGAKFKSNGEKTGNIQNTHESNSINSTETKATIATSDTTNHKSNNQDDNNLKQSNNETLDLADLDLSKLRLTKKDIETLSSITPKLPKHYQDQLLAQLPPNQARKLSRTLSMQGHGRVPCVFKRSLSSGRDALESEPSTFVSSAMIAIPPVSTAKLPPKRNNDDDDDERRLNDPSSLLLFDRNSILRRSMSRNRDQTSMHRRSISAIRSEFPSRLSYTGDLRSDYGSSKINDSKSNRYRLTDYTSIMKPEYYSKLPLPTPKTSAPQKSPSNDSLESPIHRASSQRSSARFSKRSDLYGSSSSINITDDKQVSKIQQDRERETQSVLREIRERSRDRSSALLTRRESQSHDPGSQIPVQKRDTDTLVQRYQRKSSISNVQIAKENEHVRHARTKSTQSCCDIDNSASSSMGNSNTISAQNPDQICFSRQDVEHSIVQTAAEFTDEILGELIRRSNEYSLGSSELPKANEKTIENGSLQMPKSKSKDSKKTKTKQKSPGSDNTEETKPISQDDVQSVTLPLPKSSKIARRMSQPNKEDSSNVVVSNTSKKTEVEPNEENDPKAKSTEANVLTVDTKSYPNSKLTPPKEVTLKIKKASTLSATPASSARNAITAVMEKFMEKSSDRLSPGKSITNDKSKSDVANDTSAPKSKTKKKIKVVKRLVQKDSDAQMSIDSKENAQTSNEASNETSKEASKEASKEPSFTKESKSPEKKIKSGFLHSIGQKFEKMRENSKNKEREKKMSKSSETTAVAVPTTSTEECKSEVETVQTIIIPRIVKDGDTKIIQKEEITIRPVDTIPKIDQHRSRIDAVIRNLRERSVPHTIRAENFKSDLTTESGLLKRAVSVEDMSNGLINCNKSNVNKVLGLFRRIEKEQQIQKKQSMQSEVNEKERPRSGGFVSKMKKSNRPYYTGAKSDTIVTLTDQYEKSISTNSKIPFLRSAGNAGSVLDTDVHTNNCECNVNVKNLWSEASSSHSDEKKRKNDSNDVIKPSHVPSVNVEYTDNEMSEKERIRNNRKGLVLDLTNEQYDDHFKKTTAADCSNNNNNSYNFNAIDKRYGNKCNGSNDNHVNNNFTGNGNYYPYYAHSHSHSHSHSHHQGHSERNNDAFTSSCEMNASYSSDNRSLHDDCESTSTFLSPTEERELNAFDNWSACSGSTDDAQALHPKHLKYASMRNQVELNHNQATTSNDPVTPTESESMIDRIKRRSYYCRFNEKKPKRTSSIVGSTAQREYYREQATKSKPRSSDYLSSAGSNGFHEGDGSLNRGGSKSPTPINSASATSIHNKLSRSNTPNCYSVIDTNEKSCTPQPQYHYHLRQRSHTPSSARSPMENSDVLPNKSSEYLNLRSTLTSPPASKYYSNTNTIPSSLPIGDYRHNGNRSSTLRSSAYDSLSPSIYGTYSPKRRLSTSYLGPAIAAANSSNVYSAKDQLSASCYATLGSRKPKAYDHRSLTMMDASSISPSSLISKRIGASTDHPYTHHSNYRSAHEYGQFNSRSSLRSPVHNSTSNI